uniref:Uncharacterized protein n=1 Tax=Oryza sativa subsp. japonica TaxID=39947 RepID=Q6YXT3_ORYSJ|nr:hypothetical protein [Oryza sativa Japonica Group]
MAVALLGVFIRVPEVVFHSKAEMVEEEGDGVVESLAVTTIAMTSLTATVVDGMATLEEDKVGTFFGVPSFGGQFAATGGSSGVPAGGMAPPAGAFGPPGGLYPGGVPAAGLPLGGGDQL